MTRLDSIRDRLADYEPSLARPGNRPPSEAAVALVLHEPSGGPLELLFIERAQREGDPWSGHMAFPGGRRHREDPDMQTTAARETLEEVGVRLGAPIGQLDDFAGTRNPQVAPLVVAPFVYEVRERPQTILNHEVADTVWVPIPWILDPSSAVEYRVGREAFRGGFPAFRYERYTVWGLTYRVLGNFFAVLGRSLPSYEGR